ncbi:hypothetical protein [Leptolyngbya sp. O-77]|uniref:hypothetical protein n=1 Tax=Leptolyngbya sp. O-77 TaxID=1080068 RepID=UPI0012E3C840|nr:hypothetical protein [Leptolyngbya sp. O-77]
MLAFAIAPYLPTPTPLGDRPHLSAPAPLGDRPPGYLLGRCTLTQVCRCSTSAADPKAAGSVRLDPDLEEPSLCKWGRIAYPPES